MYVSMDLPGIKGVPTNDRRCVIRFPLYALAFSRLGPTSLLSPREGHPVSATTISVS